MERDDAEVLDDDDDGMRDNSSGVSSSDDDDDDDDGICKNGLSLLTGSCGIRGNFWRQVSLVCSNLNRI